MKKLIIILLVTVASLVNAQQSLTWNEVNGDQRKGAAPVIETSDKALCIETKMFVGLSLKKADFRILNKKNYKESESFNIEFEYEGNELEFYQFVNFLDEIHILTYYFNSGKNAYYFFLQKLNDDGTLQKPVVLGVTEKKMGNYKKKWMNLHRDKLFIARQIRSVVSEDKNHFAFIIPSNLNFTNDESTSWKVVTLNSNGDKREFTFEEKNKNSLYNGLRVSNDGDVFGLEMTNLRFNILPSYHINIQDLLLTRDMNEYYASTVKAVHFNFAEKKVDFNEVVDNSDVFYNVKTELKNGQFYVYGLGESTKDFVPIESLSFVYDVNDLSVKNSALTEISRDELITDDEKFKRKKDKFQYGADKYYLLSDLLLDDKGVAYFTVQPFVTRLKQGVDANGNPYQTIIYIYKDIHVFALNRGEARMNKILATQYLRTYFPEGYHAFEMVGNVPTIFYLNEGKYVLENGGSIAGRSKQESFQSVSVSSTAELTFKELIPSTDKTISTIYLFATSKTEGGVVFYGMAKKRKKATMYTKITE